MGKAENIGRKRLLRDLCRTFFRPGMQSAVDPGRWPPQPCARKLWSTTRDQALIPPDGVQDSVTSQV